MNDVAEKLHMNDLNLVVLKGRIAHLEVYEYGTGATSIRYLVTTRVQEPKRRVDVIPVTYWDPPAEQDDLFNAPVGSQIYVTGQIQRRFKNKEGERVGTMEVVATSIVINKEENDGSPDGS